MALTAFEFTYEKCNNRITYGSVKERMGKRLLDGDAVLRLHHQTFPDQILGILCEAIISIDNNIRTTKHCSPEISAHSGDVKLYFPSMILRSITICLRCQKGGQPTSNVNIITPHAHLNDKKRAHYKSCLSILT